MTSPSAITTLIAISLSFPSSGTISKHPKPRARTTNSDSSNFSVPDFQPLVGSKSTITLGIIQYQWVQSFSIPCISFPSNKCDTSIARSSSYYVCNTGIYVFDSNCAATTYSHDMILWWRERPKSQDSSKCHEKAEDHRKQVLISCICLHWPYTTCVC